MAKYIIFIIFIFLSVNVNSLTVFGIVKNSENEILSGAKIIYGEGQGEYVYSNKKGTYSFSINEIKLKKIIFHHVQHESKTVVITKKILRRIEGNRLEMNIWLNDNVLKTVVIQVKPPKAIFGTPLYSVSDFEIDAKGRMILLTYPKNLKKGSSIKVLDDKMKVLNTFYIEEKAIELKTDFRKNIHLITKQNIYLIKISEFKIHLLKENKVDYFKYTAPIIDTLNDNLYYSNHSEIYPAFNYFQYNKTDSVITNMLAVIDESMMEQYRAEYKFSDVRTKLWAHNKQFETGIDKEVWVGASVFANSIYYEPLYAPLFVNNDSIIVFDHYKNLLFKYSSDLKYKDSVKINYHFKARASGWAQPLVQDKETGNIFALFERNGFTYLSLIDISTGEITITKRLFYRYVEKLKIVNNKVYYIYRPYESVQKKYLYEEKLNF